MKQNRLADFHAVITEADQLLNDRLVSRLWRVAGALALGLAGCLASLPSHAMVELTGISKYGLNDADLIGNSKYNAMYTVL